MATGGGTSLRMQASRIRPMVWPGSDHSRVACGCAAVCIQALSYPEIEGRSRGTVGAFSDFSSMWRTMIVA